MYFQRRGATYSFIYYDGQSKKNVRLPQSQTPTVSNDAEALQFCKNWDAKYDAMKSRIEKNLGWANKYHDYENLLKIYETSRKEEAPYSWEDCVNYIKNYVFPFFLSLKNENNMNLWHYHFEEFRDHLEAAKPLKRRIGLLTLAYSTKNNIIASLNAFIKTMYRRRLLDKDHKCRQFASNMLNRKSDLSVIDLQFQKAIYSGLLEMSTLAADFFLVSLHTGMRINEVLGLSLPDFFAEPPTNQVIQRAIRPHRLKAFGMICIESQPINRNCELRDSKKRVARKPLKGKKRIDPDDCRIIPIFDRKTFSALIRLWNEQRESYQDRKFGSDPKDYLLFDGLSQNSYSRMLAQAQKGLDVCQRFTPHDARHTYSTWLAERTGGNFMLCSMILGHSSIDITMKYIHIHSRIQRTLKTRLQLETPIPHRSQPTAPRSSFFATKPEKILSKNHKMGSLAVGNK